MALARRTLLALPGVLPFLAAAAPVALRIGYQKIGPLVLLRQQKRLDSALPGTQVSWVEFNAGPPIMEALAAGAIDVGYVGDTPPIFAQAAGTDIVYVAAMILPGRHEALLVRKAIGSQPAPIGSIADLKGKRVAFTRGSSAHNFMVKALATAGLTLRDVTVSYLAPPDAAAAFRSGAIDAWAVWDPFYATAELDPDTKVLLTGESVAPSAAFLIASRRYAEANPATLVALVQAANAVADWAGTHQEDVAQAMATITGVSLAAQRLAAGRTVFRAQFIDPAITARQQDIADTFARERLIPGTVRIADVVWTPPAPLAAPPLSQVHTQ